MNTNMLIYFLQIFFKHFFSLFCCWRGTWGHFRSAQGLLLAVCSVITSDSVQETKFGVSNLK